MMWCVHRGGSGYTKVRRNRKTGKYLYTEMHFARSDVSRGWGRDAENHPMYTRGHVFYPAGGLPLSEGVGTDGAGVLRSIIRTVVCRRRRRRQPRSVGRVSVVEEPTRDARLAYPVDRLRMVTADAAAVAAISLQPSSPSDPKSESVRRGLSRLSRHGFFHV